MSLARDVTTVGSATLLSRLLGFFRDVGIAAVLGAGVLSDAYFAALQIPNLFRRLLAEGALNSAFVPMWLRIRDAGRAPRRPPRSAKAMLGMLAAALGYRAVLCLAVRPAVIHLLAPGFRDPRRSLSARRASSCGCRCPISPRRLRRGRRLDPQRRRPCRRRGVRPGDLQLRAASPRCCWWSVRGATYVVLGRRHPVGRDRRRRPRASSSWSAARCCGSRSDPRRCRSRPSPEVRRFFRQAIPGVVAGGIPQLKLIAGAMVASSSPAAVSWLYYANRLYELPLGVVSIAIAVGDGAADRRERARRCARGEIAAAQSRAFEIAARPRAAGRGRLRRAGRCRSPAACSNAARSGRTTPPWSPPR